MPEPVEPAALQPDVEDHQRRPARTKAASAACCRAAWRVVVALIPRMPAISSADVRLVVDDQNIVAMRLCSSHASSAAATGDPSLGRKPSLPRRPAPRRSSSSRSAAMVLHDLLHDGKAKPGALAAWSCRARSAARGLPGRPLPLSSTTMAIAALVPRCRQRDLARAASPPAWPRAASRSPRPAFFRMLVSAWPTCRRSQGATGPLGQLGVDSRSPGFAVALQEQRLRAELVGSSG